MLLCPLLIADKNQEMKPLPLTIVVSLKNSFFSFVIQIKRAKRR